MVWCFSAKRYISIDQLVTANISYLYGQPVTPVNFTEVSYIEKKDEIESYFFDDNDTAVTNTFDC